MISTECNIYKINYYISKFFVYIWIYWLGKSYVLASISFIIYFLIKFIF